MLKATTVKDLDELAQMVTQIRILSHDDTFTLVANDGRKFRVSYSSLLGIPYFEERIRSDGKCARMMSVSASPDVLAVFQAFLKADKQIEDIEDVSEVIAFACEINSPQLAQYGAHHARGVKTPEVASKTSILALKQVLRYLPRRTFDEYRKLLPKFCVTDSDERVKTIVKFLTRDCLYDNVPLAIPVFQNKVTVSLMEDFQGSKVVAVLLDNKWVPMKGLFGAKFCPFAAGVTNFHLRFNKYVVYQTAEGSVMIQNLRTSLEDKKDDPPRLLFDKVKFFRSMRDQLYVIRRDEATGQDVLYEWSQQEMKFLRMFSNPRMKLTAAYQDIENQLNIVTNDHWVLTFPPNDSAQPLSWQPVAMWDAVDDWCLSKTAVYRECIYLDKTPTTVKLSAYIHGGYSWLRIMPLKNDLYQTIVHVEEGLKWVYKRGSIHGRLIAVSDVVIL